MSSIGRSAPSIAPSSISGAMYPAAPSSLCHSTVHQCCAVGDVEASITASPRHEPTRKHTFGT